jgi:hypothetical protein
MSANPVGHNVETLAGEVSPKDWEDPEPKVTGYFVVWGFALLFASIIALQFLTYAYQSFEDDRKGTPSASEATKNRRTGLDAQSFKAEQLQRLRTPQQGGMNLDAAMQKVVREKS